MIMGVSLTRRRTLGILALASAGSVSIHELTRSPSTGSGSLSERQVQKLLTIVDVVYPSSDPRQFEPTVRNYVDSLPEERRQILLGTLAELDRITADALGQPLGAASTPGVIMVMKRIGVDRVQSKPRGMLAERIRFHLVNSIMYALLTEPRVTRSFGIDNPVGYPGGFSSYISGESEQS